MASFFPNYPGSCIFWVGRSYLGALGIQQHAIGKLSLSTDLQLGVSAIRDWLLTIITLPVVLAARDFAIRLANDYPCQSLTPISYSALPSRLRSRSDYFYPKEHVPYARLD